MKAGDLIGVRYRLEAPLGAGGMGTTWKAFDLSLNRSVAVKLVQAELHNKPDLIERFQVEAAAAARIRDQYVVTIHDFGVQPDGLPFIVMELVPGKNLADIIVGRGALHPLWAVGLGLQASAALMAVHQASIVHRDVKPRNFILTEDSAGAPRLVLLDFGIAKIRTGGDGSSVKTGENVLLGTPQYMAPEQFLGLKVDARTDVYQLGATLFEMMAGRPVFDSERLSGIVNGGLMRARPRLSSLVNVSPDLDHAVARALSPYRDERFETAQAFRDCLASTPEGLGFREQGWEVLPDLRLPATLVIPPPGPAPVAAGGTRIIPVDSGPSAAKPGSRTLGAVPPVERSVTSPWTPLTLVGLGALAGAIIAAAIVPEWNVRAVSLSAALMLATVLGVRLLGRRPPTGRVPQRADREVSARRRPSPPSRAPVEASHPKVSAAPATPWHPAGPAAVMRLPSTEPLPPSAALQPSSFSALAPAVPAAMLPPPVPVPVMGPSTLAGPLPAPRLSSAPVDSPPPAPDPALAAAEVPVGTGPIGDGPRGAFDQWKPFLDSLALTADRIDGSLFVLRGESPRLPSGKFGLFLGSVAESLALASPPPAVTLGTQAFVAGASPLYAWDGTKEEPHYVLLAIRTAPATGVFDSWHKLAVEKHVYVLPTTPTAVHEATETGGAVQHLWRLVQRATEPDPYKLEGPITSELDFFGSRKEVSLRSQDIAAEGSVGFGLFGLEKWGTTSMLLRLRAEQRHRVSAWVDLAALAPLNATTVLSKISNQISRDLAAKTQEAVSPPSEPMSSLAAAEEELMGLVIACRRKGLPGPPVVFLDRVDWLIHLFPRQPQTVLDLIRVLYSVSASHSGGVRLIVAGGDDDFLTRQTFESDRPIDSGHLSLKNPFWLTMKSHYTPFLDREETSEFLERLGARAGLKYDKRALAVAYEKTGGHKYLTRLLGTHLCRDTDRRRVNVARISRASQTLLAHHRPYLNAILAHVPRETKELLRKIAVGPSRIDLGTSSVIASGSEEPPLALQFALNYNLLEESGAGHYRLRIGLLCSSLSDRRSEPDELPTAAPVATLTAGSS